VFPGPKIKFQLIYNNTQETIALIEILRNAVKSIYFTLKLRTPMLYSWVPSEFLTLKNRKNNLPGDISLKDEAAAGSLITEIFVL
jgi:hypothetical protein